jgi:hypothetical protein
MRVWLAKSIFQLGNTSHSSGTKYMCGINNEDYLQVIRGEPVKLWSQYGRSGVLPKLLEASEGKTSTRRTKRGN